MSVSFDIAAAIEGLDELRRKLPELVDILTDWEHVYDEAIHPHMISFVKEVYDEQGDPTGTSWEGYGDEPKYAAYKAAVTQDWEEGDGDPREALPDGNTAGGLMRWRGEERLYPSLTRREHEDQINRVDGLEARFGTRVPWASRLVEGGEGPFGEPYPGRPLLTHGERARDELRLAIADTYTTRIRRELGVSLDPVEMAGLA